MHAQDLRARGWFPDARLAGRCISPQPRSLAPPGTVATITAPLFSTPSVSPAPKPAPPPPPVTPAAAVGGVKAAASCAAAAAGIAPVGAPTSAAASGKDGIASKTAGSPSAGGAERVHWRAMVGKMVWIWWPLDNKYYRGRVLSYDAASKRHLVRCVLPCCISGSRWIHRILCWTRPLS